LDASGGSVFLNLCVVRRWVFYSCRRVNSDVGRLTLGAI